VNRIKLTLIITGMLLAVLSGGVTLVAPGAAAVGAPAIPESVIVAREAEAVARGWRLMRRQRVKMPMGMSVVDRPATVVACAMYDREAA
jgi:hypothetical protein